MTENTEENKEIQKVEIKEKDILKNFNLTIKGGEKVALVGKSGSGKTTIAKLISGYMNPASGTVLVDGQDLSEVSLKSYYKYIGYLTQEPMVFDGSIKENLLYAVSGEDLRNLTEENVWEALRKANCDFIEKMKDKLETQIGEKGIRLSGGERQRLAVAKLFLKNPEIIILDEPTSALDSFSEDLITKALDELFKGRTVIIIAHRLQTVKRADRILVIEEGEIVEEGKHDELVAKGGAYANMLELQSGF
jgi:ABC-type multidrug transport system fused ATPase/permease subunit